MLITWPNGSAETGSLQIPRPAVFLMGSYNPGLTAHQWQTTAAKQLEDKVGTVCYGIFPGHGLHAYTRWSLFWACEADLIVVWLEPPIKGFAVPLQWSEFEFGLCLGLARAGQARPPVVGVDRSLVYAREVIGATLESLGFSSLTYDSLPELLHAAGDIGRAF